MRRVLPTHDGKEALLQSLRNRTWCASSYAAVVDLPHRCQFGSGSSHEHFIGNVHVIAREALLTLTEPARVTQAISLGALGVNAAGKRLNKRMPLFYLTPAPEDAPALWSYVNSLK